MLCLTDIRIRWRWRWLWALFVLVGFLRYNIDWMRETSNVQIIAFIVPAAQFVRFSIYGSWVLSISAPLGAFLYWARQRAWRDQAAVFARGP